MAKSDYKNLLDALESLGLKQEEAQIYIALLELKEALLSDIAKTLGANRTTLYPYVNRLLKMGLLKKSVKGKRILYLPESPEILKKIQEAQARKLNANIANLQELYSASRNEPTVLFYNGIDGMRQIYDEMISETGFLYSIFSVDDYFEIFQNSRDGEKFLKEVEKKGIDLKELVKHSASGVNYAEYGYLPQIGKIYKFNKRPIKLLPEDFKINSDLLISHEKVAFVSLRSQNALLVKDKDIAKLQKLLFENLWNFLS